MNQRPAPLRPSRTLLGLLTAGLLLSAIGGCGNHSGSRGPGFGAGSGSSGGSGSGSGGSGSGALTFDLVTPVDGATGLSATPTLVWGDATGETGYDLEIADDAAFAGVIHTATLAADVISYAVPPGSLVAGNGYFWRVTAQGPTPALAGNAPFGFTTQVPLAPLTIGSFEAGDLATEGWVASDGTRPAMATLRINEVDADTTSTDTMEFIELYDGGVGNTPLDGLAVVFFNGSDDRSYPPQGGTEAIDLDGMSTNAEGFFVIGNTFVTQANLVIGDNSVQNGADAVALYQANGSDFPNDTAITMTGLVDAVVYDTNDSDDAGLLTLLSAGPQVDEDSFSGKDIHSNHRYNDGVGGARDTQAFRTTSPTPGAPNNPLRALQVVGSGQTPPGLGLFNSTPSDGSLAVVHGWDGVAAGSIEMALDVMLDSRTNLSFDYRAGWDFTLGLPATQARVLNVRVEPVGGGAALATTTIFSADPATAMTMSDTGLQTGNADLSLFANSMVRIVIAASVPEPGTGPAFLQLDGFVLAP